VLLALTAAVVACQSGPQKGGEASVRQHLTRAQGFLDAGLVDSALAEFGLALEENPTVIEAHMGMGRVFLQRQDYALAANAFQRAVALDPNNFDGQYQLGLSFQLLGKLEDAVRAYLRALLLRPDSAQANYNLASAYLQLGRADAAMPYAVRSTLLAPDNQQAWANLAAARSLLGEYEQAIEAYRQAVELGQQEAPIMLGLAAAHLKLGRYAQAIAVLRSLLQAQRSATACERLGFAYFKMRRLDDALAAYRESLAVNPNETGALNGVGAVMMTRYIQGGLADKPLRDQALESWRKSVTIRAEQPRIVDLIARYQQL